MKKRWTINSNNNIEAINNLTSTLNIPSVIAKLLSKRGIKSSFDARDFFRPTLEQLHNPFLMKGMNEAIIRIEQAIAQNDKILIYGDYDVDGTTSVALVYSFLYKLHKNIDYYIPNRYTEGRGISQKGIDWAIENKCNLIIALDCGIKSGDMVSYAKENGIEFIICDHHLPGDSIPNAVAVLDPKMDDCNYPYKDLSACGIGFKLIQAYCKKNYIDISNILHYLDLVAISIAADLVPVTGENRTLAYFGLEKINTNPCFGIKALIAHSSNKNINLNFTDIVFQIGPRINAAGRIGDAKIAVKLLIAESYQDAIKQSRELNNKNKERKEIDYTITSEALEILDFDENFKNKRSTVLFSPNWNQGVIGIVASRLVEKYYKPTVILTTANGKVIGSARSVNGFDIHEAISNCSDIIEQFGGHKYAVGLTIATDKVIEFTERFEQIVSSTIVTESLFQEIEIDDVIEFSDISSKMLRYLKQFAPFGTVNTNPIFETRNVLIKNNKVFLQGNHMKFYVESIGTNFFECKAFNLAQHYNLISKGIPFKMCYCIEEQISNGKTTIILNVKDIKFE